MPCFFFFTGKHVVRIAEAVPTDGDRQHAQPRAQVARHKFQGRDITAMAGDEHQLAQPGTRETLTKFGPRGDGGLR